MALFHTHYFSQALNMETGIEIIMPNPTLDPQRDAKPIKTLYLLHGLSDDETAWTRYTSIERYARERGIAVVMPTTYRFWYADSLCGKYYTYIADELPRVMRYFFPHLSDRREDTMIAGLSMGGYGAWRIALSRPDLFGGAASLSGALLRGSCEITSEMSCHTVFGEHPKGGENDVQYLMTQAQKKGGPLPDLYHWCGTEDFLFEDNCRMQTFAEQAGYPSLEWRKSAGNHEWKYWDEQICPAIDWMLERAEDRKETER